MPRGRSASYEDQREMILAHAAELFARRGYSATSMNEVAQACGLSKATLYHYFKDKYALLLSIADDHVSRLTQLVEEPELDALHGESKLRHLISRIVQEYANAQHAHRVLTEDVKFLNDQDQEHVLGKERIVVEGFARAVAHTGKLGAEQELSQLAKPLTMLLFGMINWMFTWMRPDGELGYDAMGPIVADLFLGGIGNVKTPPDMGAVVMGAHRQAAISSED